MKIILITGFLLSFSNLSHQSYTLPCKKVPKEECKKVTKTVYETKTERVCQPVPDTVCADVDERECEIFFKPVEERVATLSVKLKMTLTDCSDFLS